jgi:hypothetical protein
VGMCTERSRVDEGDSPATTKTSCSSRRSPLPPLPSAAVLCKNKEKVVACVEVVAEMQRQAMLCLHRALSTRRLYSEMALGSWDPPGPSRASVWVFLFQTRLSLSAACAVCFAVRGSVSFCGLVSEYARRIAQGYTAVCCSLTVVRLLLRLLLFLCALSRS